MTACKTSSTVLIPISEKENSSQFKCVSYMGWTGNTAEKKPPGQISKSVIQDEMSLIKIDENKINCRLLLRSHTSSDQSFDAYQVKLNGKVVPVITDSSTVEVKDYEYSGSYTIAYLRSSVLDFDIDKPIDRIFRVIEREVFFSIPASLESTDEIKIDIGASIDHNGAKLGTKFIFKIV